MSQRGTLDTINWIKQSRLCYTRFLAGSPFSVSPDPGVSITSYGLPKGVLIPLMKKTDDVNSIRLANTLLGISRVLPGHKKPDLSTITTPSTSIDPWINFQDDVKAIMTRKGWRLSRPIWDRYHLSTRAGPNCQAMVGAALEASLLSQETLTYIKILGGEELIKKIEVNRSLDQARYMELFAPKLVGKPLRLSKLSQILDREGKNRIIAIVDYWSQSALFPLHKGVFSLLKRIRNDCTFNQSHFRSILPQQGPYYSYDLTAATDRFPIDFQEMVVSILVGDKEYANAWKEIISNREFYVPWTGDTIKYSCGQPMGAYSSWAVFTLCHHIVVALAAKRCNIHHFTDYALLGDDIVIANTAVAQEYALILASLGVSISETKSHVSVDTYEFAKRWIHKGQEVSGLPLSLFSLNYTKPKWFDIVEGVKQAEARWLPRYYTLASPAFFTDLFKAYGLHHGLSVRLSNKARIFLEFPMKGDHLGRLTEKCIFLSSHFFPGLLGCSNLVRSKVLIWSLLSFAKTALVASAMKKSVRTANTVIRKLLTSGLIPESDSQSILFDLVIPSVCRDYCQGLQEVYEKLRGFMQSGRGRPITIGANYYRLTLLPEDIMSHRSERLSIYTNVSILWKAKKLSSAIQLDRHLASLESTDDSNYSWMNFHKALGA